MNEQDSCCDDEEIIHFLDLLERFFSNNVKSICPSISSGYMHMAQARRHFNAPNNSLSSSLLQAINDSLKSQNNKSLKLQLHDYGKFSPKKKLYPNITDFDIIANNENTYEELYLIMDDINFKDIQNNINLTRAFSLLPLSDIKNIQKEFYNIILICVEQANLKLKLLNLIKK
ncbi:unnamed protein product [Gordionus sp. m RMFG-2023]